WPAVVGIQDILHDGIDTEEGSISSNFGLRRNGCWCRQAHLFPLTLVSEKGECLVLPDGDSNRSTKLVVDEDILWIGFLIKKVSGVKVIVAEVFKRRAVDRVGSRLGDYINDGPGVAPIFGLGIIEDCHLLYGVDRKQRGRNSKNATLIDSRVVAEAVVHIGSVNQKIVGAPPVAINGENSE